jgi:SAM-dependent methyltransferase
MSEGQHESRRALRFRFLTRFYDPLFRWGLREARVKGDLVGQATLLAGQSVLDVGCGTGTLALAIRAACPGAHVVGLDADPEILLIAAGKAGKAAAPIRFDRGLATALPYPDGAFDHVFSSLMLHHLTGGERREALRQVVRVVKPGGRFHLVDWDRPQAWPLHLPFFLVRALDGFDRTEDSARGRLPALLGEAGFGEVEHLGRYATVGGTLGRYRATKS